MTSEELREKVIHAVMVVPDAYLGPAAAIRVVLEAAMKACANTFYIVEAQRAIRSLLPQDKQEDVA